MDSGHDPDVRMPAKLSTTEPTEIMRVVVTTGWLHRLDEWRRREPDLPNRSEAIRRLVERAIATAKQARKS
jgi:metal-responsive CopG/Arc/MetJ family transcriptional regulator